MGTAKADKALRGKKELDFRPYTSESQKRRIKNVMDNNTAKFLADMLEESKDKMAQLLVSTRGLDKSEQDRISRIIRILRKEAEAPK